jgi:hypothetical protein
MEHRGIRYLILARIERGEWSVRIYLGTATPLEKRIKGTREEATKHAQLMIDQWLQRHSQTSN